MEAQCYRQQWYPPLHKTQGRGTQVPVWERETKRMGHPPIPTWTIKGEEGYRTGSASFLGTTEVAPTLCFQGVGTSKVCALRCSAEHFHLAYQNLLTF